MIGRFAGLLSILGGAALAAGAFPTWVTQSGTDYNAFNVGPNYRDAIISFAIAAALLLLGFALAVWPMAWSRFLDCLAGIAGALWAGLLFFALVPQARAVLIASGASEPITGISLGLWITAGGGALGLLAGLIALTARRPRVAAVAPAVAPSAPSYAPAGSAVPRPAPQPAPVASTPGMVPPARPAATPGAQPGTPPPGSFRPVGAPPSSNPPGGTPPSQLGPR